MQRWHRERHIARRHLRDRAQLIHSESDQQLGRFRKLNGLGCGRARCFLCHGDKLLDRQTREESLADLKMKEGLEELYGR
jgi:hypothetical protein